MPLSLSRESVSIVYGYAKADNANAWAKIIDANIEDATFGADGADWYFSNTNANDGTILYMPGSRRQSSLNCYLQYNEATSNASPSINLTTTGC
ncbi:hypothetical protein [Vibrio europaeus]|uniref:hypothetical protein n=1 Tax=Vibrio europaeus TaxID=300876 RepID=UPI0023701492|nr:hypothetical protein [Vibrio europaeus]